LTAPEEVTDNTQRAIEQTPPGFALLADCRRNDRAAAGHILLARLQARGAAGFVTDGSARDSAQVATLPLPAIDAAVRRVFDDGAYQRARPCRSPLSDDRDPISVVAPPRMSGVRRWILSH
jgi:regulator of RNase E activity RraA